MPLNLNRPTSVKDVNTASAPCVEARGITLLACNTRLGRRLTQFVLSCHCARCTCSHQTYAASKNASVRKVHCPARVSQRAASTARLVNTHRFLLQTLTSTCNRFKVSGKNAECVGAITPIFNFGHLSSPRIRSICVVGDSPSSIPGCDEAKLHNLLGGSARLDPLEVRSGSNVGAL